MKAALKASVLFAFGRAPGGARLYRYLTRIGMGTQATHVDKLARGFRRIGIAGSQGSLAAKSAELSERVAVQSSQSSFVYFALESSGRP